jgi:2-polyprenyl-3-methyl-5-hydroxy-6-metoxy-1,4-benzoquinol methylase
MSKRRVLLFGFIGISVLGLSLADTLAFQLKSRPAAEWIERLNRPERLKELRIDEIVKGLGLKPGDVVADLGAGGGAFEGALAEAVGPTGKVYAVEIDQGFIDFIDKAAKDAGLANVQTVLGEFTDPNLGDVKVDVAMFHDVLHHIEKRAEYIKNLDKYIKPTGRVAVIELNKEDPNTSHKDEPELQVGKEELDAWMDGIGFKRVQEHTFLGIAKWYLIYGRQ